MTAVTSDATVQAGAEPERRGAVPLVVVGPRTRVGRSLLARHEGPVPVSYTHLTLPTKA